MQQEKEGILQYQQVGRRPRSSQAWLSDSKALWGSTSGGGAAWLLAQLASLFSVWPPGCSPPPPGKQLAGMAPLGEALATVASWLLLH